MSRRDDLAQYRRRPRWRRWLLAAAVVAPMAWLACGWLTIAVAMAPHPAEITARTELDGHPVEAVAATTRDGLDVRAWLVRRAEHRIVILLAGLGGNRTSNLGVAGYYLERGWSVLLPDLRGTGESGGDHIGFGYPERLDLLAWFDFARQRGFREIGLHGQSLGAAAITFAWQPIAGDVAFVVLDSCYDDIRHALHNRLPGVPLPDFTLLPVKWLGASAIGTDIAALRPIDRVTLVRCPTLVVAGDQDPYARPEETRALFSACGAQRKQLAWIRGGRHENLWAKHAAQYRRALDDFFGR